MLLNQIRFKCIFPVFIQGYFYADDSLEIQSVHVARCEYQPQLIFLLIVFLYCCVYIYMHGATALCIQSHEVTSNLHVSRLDSRCLEYIKHTWMELLLQYMKDKMNPPPLRANELGGGNIRNTPQNNQ